MTGNNSIYNDIKVFWNSRVMKKKADVPREIIEENKPKEKPSALTTMIVSTVDRDKRILNQITNNFSVRTIVDKETCDLVLNTKLLKLEIGSMYNVGVLATKDPTPCTAFGAVSLGYKRMAWIMTAAKLISLDPPTFRGWKKNYKVDILLEMWE